jgi:hypothetical protein
MPPDSMTDNTDVEMLGRKMHSKQAELQHLRRVLARTTIRARQWMWRRPRSSDKSSKQYATL